MDSKTPRLSYCAWCQNWFTPTGVKIRNFSAEPISHGICRECSAEMIRRARETHLIPPTQKEAA
jgi:hypothetical protein